MIVAWQARVSRAVARRRIIEMALFSNHRVSPRPTTGEEVARTLQDLGYDPERLAEELRDYRRAVPVFENLVPAGTWTLVGDATAQLVDSVSLKPIGPIVRGPALLVDSTSDALFENAVSARNRAVATGSYSEFQSAVTIGLAAIEAFINDQVAQWNALNPDAALLDLQRSTTLKEKMRDWVPRSSRGRLDLSGAPWNAVASLQAVRNEYTIHAHHSTLAIEARTFAKQLNQFRDGIASVLFGLHWAYQQTARASLINAKHWPSAEVSVAESSS